MIIELKNDEFKHEYLGQLNVYVSYYKEKEMNKGDNPPMGIYYVHEKVKKWLNTLLPEWIINCLFQPNLLQLPEQKVLEEFLLNEITLNK